MFNFLADFSYPESILPYQNGLFSVFVTDFEKREFCKFLPKTTLFHINWYLIGNLITMYDFLAGFSSSESILADKMTYFPFCNGFRKTGIL